MATVLFYTHETLEKYDPARTRWRRFLTPPLRSGLPVSGFSCLEPMAARSQVHHC